MSSFLADPYIPAYCATALGVLHLVLAIRMTYLRVVLGMLKKKIRDSKKNDGSGSNEYQKKLIEKRSYFEIASKAQLNVAEYTGFFLPIILYIQSEVNRNKKLSNVGLYSVCGAVFGQFMFAFGFNIVKKITDTNIFRIVGALTRYCTMATLLYEIVALSKPINNY
eukprot:127144_1